jgi:hypothetical protein
MSSLLVFNRVYGLEIQLVMLVFSTPLVDQIPNQTKPRRRGASDTCRQVPLLVNFQEKPTFRVWCLYRYLFMVQVFTRVKVTAYM